MKDTVLGEQRGRQSDVATMLTHLSLAFRYGWTPSQINKSILIILVNPYAENWCKVWPTTKKNKHCFSALYPQCMALNIFKAETVLNFHTLQKRIDQLKEGRILSKHLPK